MQNIIGPLELNRLLASQIGDDISHHQTSQQRNLLWQEMILNWQYEGGRQRIRRRPPRVAASAATADLFARQDQGWRKELAALPQQGGIIVGAAQPREPIQPEWLD